MSSVKDILTAMQLSPHNIKFSDLEKVCSHYFGKPRIRGSHHYYTVPWEGEPLINIQNDKGKAKSYQVKQVLLAVHKLEELNENEQSI